MRTRVATSAALLTCTVLAAAPASSPAAKVKKQPASWTKAQKDAKALFAVLRRPAKPTDKLPGKTSSKTAPVVLSRRVGSLNGKTFYLVLRSTQVCLAVTFSGGRSAGEQCVPVAKITARKGLPQALEAGITAIDFIVVVPDGATVARTQDGVTTPQTVAKNAALISTTLGGTVDVTFKGGAVLKLPLGLSL